MSITIDEINDPLCFDSKHWVHYKVGGDKEVIQITGACSLNQPGCDKQGTEQSEPENVCLLIKMPVEPHNGRFFQVESTAPLVTINSSGNDRESADGRCAVEEFECRLEDAVLAPGDVFPITARIVPGDSGISKMRLGYSVTLLCVTVEERPPAEEYQ